MVVNDFLLEPIREGEKNFVQMTVLLKEEPKFRKQFRTKERQDKALLSLSLGALQQSHQRVTYQFVVDDDPEPTPSPKKSKTTTSEESNSEEAESDPPQPEST